MILTFHSLASFVTTYMEPEVEKLMVDAFSKNFIDYEEYPVSADIQNRCVSMIARLFNIPSHDENTIGICAILGTTYTGEYDSAPSSLSDQPELIFFFLLGTKT